LKAEGKLAQRIAGLIEGDIASGGYAPGVKLGTEEGLAERYQVSRSVLREALALVEHSGLASSRRGKGGGLIVGGATAESIAANLQRYLDVISRDVEETLDIRRTVEGLTSRLAAQRLDEMQLQALLELVALGDAARSPQEQVAAVVRMVRQTEQAARNPMLQVLSLLVGRQTLHHLGGEGAQARLFARAGEDVAHRKALVLAIVANDGGHGWPQVCQIMDLFAEVIVGPKRPAKRAAVFDPDLLPALHGMAKETGLAGGVAVRLRNRIVDEKLGEGDLLGSEAALIAELGVGRGVFRSAVRLLEQLSVVKMAPGKNGGLRVLTPDPSAVIAGAVGQLRALGVRWAHVEEVVEVLAPLALERALAGAAAAGRQDLAAIFEFFRTLEGASLRDFAVAYQQAMAQVAASETPTLSFMFSLMEAVIRLCEGGELDEARVSVVLPDGLDRLQDAILAGNVALARRRMILLPKAGFRFGARFRTGAQAGR